MHLIPNKFDASVAFVVCESGEYNQYISSGKIWYTQKNPLFADWNCVKPLPPGDWEICFKHSEASEYDYKKVIIGDELYRDYDHERFNGVNHFIYPSLSFASLLRAHGIDLTKEIIVIKRK